MNDALLPSPSASPDSSGAGRPSIRASAEPLTHETARAIVKRHGEAWEQQDSSLIVQLLTKNATYHEQLFGKPIRDRKQIGKYWHTRVIRRQKNTKFKLLDLFVDGRTAIADGMPGSKWSLATKGF